MNNETIERLISKTRELGVMVSSVDTSGMKPLDILPIISMCRSLDEFLTYLEAEGRKK